MGISPRGLGLEFEKRIRKAISDNAELTRFIEEVKRQYEISRVGYAITYPNTARAFLEMLPLEPTADSILALTRLLIHVEYWKATKLLEREPAEILSTLSRTLLSISKERMLSREELERARMIAETVYTLTLSAQR